MFRQDGQAPAQAAAQRLTAEAADLRRELEQLRAERDALAAAADLAQSVRLCYSRAVSTVTRHMVHRSDM